MPAYVAQFGSKEVLLNAEDLTSAAAKVEALGGPRGADLLECGDISEVRDPQVIAAAAEAGHGLLVRPIWARRPLYHPLDPGDDAGDGG